MEINYSGKDNYGHPKSEYLTKLKEMSDYELYETTKDLIWLSAYANNNPRSDYHWKCDACYDVWKSRGRLEQYDKAWHVVSGL